jgi:hypothetical protein
MAPTCESWVSKLRKHLNFGKYIELESIFNFVPDFDKMADVRWAGKIPSFTLHN